MLTYISLFSSAGVGCYGFKSEGFECIATNELIQRRLNVQKFNDKCKYESGYILGDITDELIHDKLLKEVEFWKKKEKIKDVDVLVATPPCQGMSVANHKKTSDEIVRNSLVVESLKIIKEIKPRFFILENVKAFMKTICTDVDKVDKPISDAINNNLGDQYSIYSTIINFKNYGACSSRTRTLVIGVRNDISDYISPLELLPDYSKEKSLRETIGHLPALKEWGEISEDDIYHGFRIYPEHMRKWLELLKEGESAFDNEEKERIPHKIVDGEIVFNKNKNGDKYKRQVWNKVGPCIHTRNDQLASQNTVHPSDDRVFSIRELMLMMGVPEEFKWVETDISVLNSYTYDEKRKFLKKEEIKIRQSLGEAVPTCIFKAIAIKIKKLVSKKVLNKVEINNVIKLNQLDDEESILNYIIENFSSINETSLRRLIELSNPKREVNAAFFTNKKIVTEVLKHIPTFENFNELRILEPSVGLGNFLPLLIKKYAHIPKVIIDVVDIDGDILNLLKVIMERFEVPSNIHINFINADFLLHNFTDRYNLVIGNPPFGKTYESNDLLKIYHRDVLNIDTKNIFSFFMEKAFKLGDFISLITPKSLLNSPEFKKTRELMEEKKVSSILDFGEKGFDGVKIETVCINVSWGEKPKKTLVKSITNNLSIEQEQKYIFDKKLPYWIIYRDKSFDDVYQKLEFNVFQVFRDRQITNDKISLEKKENFIRVIKSRNIADDGSGIINIDGYDSYIDISIAKQLGVYKYINSENIYITPNMTYNPRVILKPVGTLVNGSAAILIPKTNFVLTKKQMKYFSTNEYRKFYRIARNYQTRSLNVDSSSVFFFGKLID